MEFEQIKTIPEPIMRSGLPKVKLDLNGLYDMILVLPMAAKARVYGES